MGVLTNIISGDLTLYTEDGTELSARTDIDLARKWAEHEYGSTRWSALSMSQQMVEVADALTALRSAYACG